MFVDDTGAPSKRMLPVSGSSRPMRSCSRVDLPQPLGPMSTVVLPRAKLRSVGCSAIASRYFLLTFSSSSSAFICAVSLFRDREMEDTKPAAGIGPDAGSFAKPGCNGQLRETFNGVLVGELSDDRFAGRENKVPVGDSHGLRPVADQVHFDAALFFVVNGAVLPVSEAEVRAQLPV